MAQLFRRRGANINRMVLNKDVLHIEETKKIIKLETGWLYRSSAHLGITVIARQL
jgi:hypothetical protein